MKIRHTDLTKVFHTLMDALEAGEVLGHNKSNSGEFTFTEDFYWDIMEQERYDLHAAPKPTIGSTAHDLERILQLLSDDDLDNSPLPQHFKWLGDVLIAMADKMNSCVCKHSE